MRLPWALAWTLVRPGACSLPPWLRSGDNTSLALVDGTSTTPIPCACLEGWSCEPEGACVPEGFNATTACKASGAVPHRAADRCPGLVAAALAVARRWLLVLVSNPLKETAVAGETLGQQYLRTWRAAADKVEADLDAAQTSLTPGTHAQLREIVAQAWQSRPVEQIDISKSYCAETAMDLGHRRCFYSMVKLMQGTWVQRGSPPEKVATTQPRIQGTIARAVDYMARKTGNDMLAHMYMLELLPNVQTQIFRPLKMLTESEFKAAAGRIRLHVVKPLKGGPADIAAETGLPRSQVVMEDLLPVADPFGQGALPRPGEAADVQLQAHLPREEAFLEGSTKDIHIMAEDTVSLLAFGAQPPPDTVSTYTEHLTKLGPLQRKNHKARTKGLHWVFVDTGDPELEEQRSIYNETASMAEPYNRRQEEAGGRVRLVPFTHNVEPLRRLKGRCDMIITFAGSFPSGELLALAKRGDARHILIEVGGTQGLGRNARRRMRKDNWWEREAWEKTAFLYMHPVEQRNYKYLAKRLDATLLTTDNFVDAWEDTGAQAGGHCPELGACNSQLWDGKSVCKVASHRCEALVADVMGAARRWTLLLTSSGGGGHMVAARTLGERHERAWNESMTAAVSKTDASRELMTERGYEGLRAVVAHSRQLAQPVIEIDLMDSPCTNLLGEHGLGMGKAFSGAWNFEQSLGNVRALTAMSKGQGFEDNVFHSQCKKYMTKVIGGNRLGRASPPTSVVSCQPMQHAAVAAAVDDVAAEAGNGPTLDIFLTELPTNHTLSFFDPLRILALKYPQPASRVRLHTIPPAEGGRKEIAEVTGLNTSQIVFEEFMPVSEKLHSAEVLGPGSAANITLKAQFPHEEKFLGGTERVFQLAAEDTLTLVMLGSQPPVTTMHNYMQTFARLKPRRAAKTSGLSWVFLATGDPAQSLFGHLYRILAEEAERFNFLQQLVNGTVRFVPFTRQDVLQLEGRADVTLTRSGGITSGELLALSKRGDRRQVLLHLQIPKEQQEHEPEANSKDRGQWEQIALTEGMVPWEMGNALYLQRILNATLVTPKTLGEVW